MRQFYYFLVVFAAICWGSIGLFVKKMTVLGFNEWEMLFIKVLFGSIILLIVLLCKNKKLLCLKQIKDMKYFIGTGIVSFTFFSICYMRALAVTSLGVAAVLLYTAPTIVMLFSILLFGEKLTGRKVITLFTTFAGCVLVTGIIGQGGQNSITLGGLLFGLGAGLGYALYSVFGAIALKEGYHPVTITFYTFLMASLFLLFFVNPVTLLQQITKTGSWSLVIAFSAITTLIPYLAYTVGLSHVKPSRASVMATIEPVVAAALGILVFREDAGFLKLLGMALVLCAVLFIGSDQPVSKE